MMNVHCVLVHVTYTLGLPPTKAVDPGAVEMKVTRTNLTYLHYTLTHAGSTGSYFSSKYFKSLFLCVIDCQPHHNFTSRIGNLKTWAITGVITNSLMRTHTYSLLMTTNSEHRTYVKQCLSIVIES